MWWSKLCSSPIEGKDVAMVDKVGNREKIIMKDRDV
jgi:hypothetical protein